MNILQQFSTELYGKITDYLYTSDLLQLTSVSLFFYGRTYSSLYKNIELYERDIEKIDKLVKALGSRAYALDKDYAKDENYVENNHFVKHITINCSSEYEDNYHTLLKVFIKSCQNIQSATLNGPESNELYLEILQGAWKESINISIRYRIWYDCTGPIDHQFIKKMIENSKRGISKNRCKFVVTLLDCDDFTRNVSVNKITDKSNMETYKINVCVPQMDFLESVGADLTEFVAGEIFRRDKLIVSQILSHCPNLTVLDLKGSKFILDNVHEGKIAENLEELRLSGRDCTPEALSKWFEYCPNLEILRISGWTKTPIDLQKIFNTPPGLIYIET